jgi:hypothetical protein
LVGFGIRVNFRVSFRVIVKVNLFLAGILFCEVSVLVEEVYFRA